MLSAHISAQCILGRFESESRSFSKFFGAKTIKLQAIRDNGKFLEKTASESEVSGVYRDKNFADLGKFNVANIPRREQIDVEKQFREVGW